MAQQLFFVGSFLICEDYRSAESYFTSTSTLNLLQAVRSWCSILAAGEALEGHLVLGVTDGHQVTSGVPSASC